MSEYSVDRIFSDEEIEFTKNVFYESSKVNTFQFHHLFHVRTISVNLKEESTIKTKLTDIFCTLDDYVKKNYSNELKRYSSYFLNYEKDGFARLHKDHETRLTVVTILDSNDLIGGDTVVNLRYKTRSRPGDYHCVRSERESKRPPYNQSIVPHVVRTMDGDSILYNQNLVHGVSLVESGNRLVFINWYK